MVQMDSLIFSYPCQLSKPKWTEGANETTCKKNQGEYFDSYKFHIVLRMTAVYAFPCSSQQFLKILLHLIGIKHKLEAVFPR